MGTISVYFDEEAERKRRTNKRLALVAASILALVAIGKREPPPPLVVTKASTPAPPPPVKVVEKIVYVDRTVLQYTSPIGPPAPAAPPVRPRRPPKPAPSAQPAQIAQTPPVTVTAPTPPPTPHVIIARPLLIEPRALHFVRGGSQRVTVTNPNATAMAVHAIRLATNADARGGFELRDHERCIRTLAPGESCVFMVTASPTTRGAVSVVIDHDA